MGSGSQIGSVDLYGRALCTIVRTFLLLPESSLTSYIRIVGGGVWLIEAVVTHLRRVRVRVVAGEGGVHLSAISHDDLVGLKMTTLEDTIWRVCCLFYHRLHLVVDTIDLVVHTLEFGHHNHNERDLQVSDSCAQAIPIAAGKGVEGKTGRWTERRARTPPATSAFDGGTRPTDRPNDRRALT